MITEACATKQVQQTQDIVPLPGFTKPNNHSGNTKLVISSVNQR